MQGSGGDRLAKDNITAMLAVVKHCLTKRF
jgi:hypothetical protein